MEKNGRASCGEDVLQSVSGSQPEIESKFRGVGLAVGGRFFRGSSNERVSQLTEKASPARPQIGLREDSFTSSTHCSAYSLLLLCPKTLKSLLPTCWAERQNELNFVSCTLRANCRHPQGTTSIEWDGMQRAHRRCFFLSLPALARDPSQRREATKRQLGPRVRSVRCPASVRSMSSSSCTLKPANTRPQKGILVSYSMLGRPPGQNVMLCRRGGYPGRSLCSAL